MQQLGLSTCWASGPAVEAPSLLAAIADAGLTTLELEYRLSARVLEGLRAELRPRGLSVRSVHNFTPIPPGIPPEAASGDVFNLASTDGEERLLAVRHTIATMELAAELEAPAVVLHLGGIPELARPEVGREAAGAGEMTPELARLLELRAKAAPPHLDAACFALDRLIPRAEALGVRLGLENRFHPYQVPDFAELGVILGRFAGAPAGLWLDTGHAFVRQRSGLEPVEAWVEAFGPGLVGCHLHDAVDDADHKVPGRGDMDWDQLAALLLDAPVKVLEIHPGPDAAELREGAALVAEAFARAEAAREKDGAGPGTAGEGA